MKSASHPTIGLFRPQAIALILLAVLLGVSAFGASAVYADTIYSDNFDAYTPSDNVAQTTGNEWSDSDGNGADVRINDNNRLVLRNAGFSTTNLDGVGTEGFENIVVTFDCQGQENNDAGQDDLALFVDVDGEGVGQGPVLVETWGAGPEEPCGNTTGFVPQSVNLSTDPDAPAGIEDNPLLRIRLRGRSLNSSPGENVRVDNFVLSGDPIPTANLIIEKECLGDFGVEASFTIDVQDAQGSVLGEPLELPCEGTSDPIEIEVDVEYTVIETETNGADDVRYRGVCDGGGTLTVPADQAGQTVTCVVTNVDLVMLTVDKVCDPEDLGGTYQVELYRESVDPGNLETTFTLECGGSDTFEIDDTVEYVIQESDPGGGIEVSYSGDCSEQEGEVASVTAEGADVSCTVTNTDETAGSNLAIITVEKDFTDDSENTVEITLVCGEATVEMTDGDGTLGDTETVTYNVTFEGESVVCTVAESELPDYSESVVCEEEGEIVGAQPYGATYDLTVEPGLTYLCTFTNEPSEEESGFVKYTDPEDEVLRQVEEFSWFIQVPASLASWYLWDFLPPGMILTGINAPEGVGCAPILAFGVLCSGASSEEPVTIELIVRASIVCGEYKNLAKLFTGLEHPQVAFDTVMVCGEEIPEEEEEITNLDGSSAASWWERLWGVLAR
jgi:hypothetical protein